MCIKCPFLTFICEQFQVYINISANTEVVNLFLTMKSYVTGLIFYSIHLFVLLLLGIGHRKGFKSQNELTHSYCRFTKTNISCTAAISP